MKVKKLDHIGIVVKKIENALPFYQTGLGLTLHPVRSEHDKGNNSSSNLNISASDASNGAGIEEVVAMKVRVAKLPVGSVTLELIEPLEGEQAVSKFLEKKGEGIHHICLEVENIKEAMNHLAAKGYKPLYPEPKIGAGGHLVNFLSPKDTSGVLIEIAEAKPQINTD